MEAYTISFGKVHEDLYSRIGRLYSQDTNDDIESEKERRAMNIARREKYAAQSTKWAGYHKHDNLAAAYQAYREDPTIWSINYRYEGVQYESRPKTKASRWSPVTEKYLEHISPVYRDADPTTIFWVISTDTPATVAVRESTNILTETQRLLVVPATRICGVLTEQHRDSWTPDSSRVVSFVDIIDAAKAAGVITEEQAVVATSM